MSLRVYTGVSHHHGSSPIWVYAANSRRYSGGLSATIDQLDTRHAGIAELLQGLMDLSATSKAGINAYLRQAGG